MGSAAIGRCCEGPETATSVSIREPPKGKLGVVSQGNIQACATRYHLCRDIALRRTKNFHRTRAGSWGRAGVLPPISISTAVHER